MSRCASVPDSSRARRRTAVTPPASTGAVETWQMIGFRLLFPNVARLVESYHSPSVTLSFIEQECTTVHECTRGSTVPSQCRCATAVPSPNQSSTVAFVPSNC